jgi:MYXO-CTERM domain-containing protein
MRYLIACLGVFLTLVTHASAVIITTGDGSGNTTAPPDDPGFANVGIRGSGTAVYLGSGWVLTAAHVGAGSTWFNGVDYSAVPNSAVQLPNPPGQGFTANSDLMLYQISRSPDLPSIQIGSASPAAGWQVTMVGNGRDRVGQEAYWTSSWISSSTPSTYAGYIWTGFNDIRWGTNVISMTGIPEGVGTNSETAFQTTFTAGGSPYEAQGAVGDSGGAVFHEDASGHWTLAGIMFAVNNLVGQPMGTSVFGDVTYSADLSIYRSEIYHIMALPGDANFDGVVNGVDLNLVASEWGQQGTGANDPHGDVNHDGVVNGLDETLVLSHWSYPLGTPGVGVSATFVPEPASVILGLVGVAALLAAGFWQRRRGAASSATSRG